MQETLALVDGKPLKDFPQNLYIPPDALAVYLHRFEGPLDLLLWLIQHHRLDVLDIPMALLTAQYMSYVSWMRGQRLELAAEYLVMAVWLIEIKSRLLLPIVKASDGEVEEPFDPRIELMQRLREYEKIRLAAQQLDQLPRMGRDMFAVHILRVVDEIAFSPMVDVNDFLVIWQALRQRNNWVVHHKAARRELSVNAAMSRMLSDLQGDLFVDFYTFFDAHEGVAHLVVNFLALLELARECQLDIMQQQAFAPIYLRGVINSQRGIP